MNGLLRSSLIRYALCVILLASCGRKLPPVAVETLGIPAPSWVEISYADDSVLLKNPSDNFVYVERAAAELGDFGFPYYRRVTLLSPNETYTDVDIRTNVSYLYRFSTYDRRFDAYSEPHTRAVSFRGPIYFESAGFAVRGTLLCAEFALSGSAARAEIFINGQKSAAESGGCYSFPLVNKLLAVLVPYSEAGVTGQAYSETIDLAALGLLLPPQNLRIIRSASAVSLSFDHVEGATGYRMSVKGRVTNISAEESIFRIAVDENECVTFSLYTLRRGAVSPPLTAESCP